MLFSELHASILNGKKKKKLVLQYCKKQIITERFHKSLHDAMLEFPNNEISTSLSLFSYAKLPIVREHKYGFRPPWKHSMSAMVNATCSIGYLF